MASKVYYETMKLSGHAIWPLFTLEESNEDMVRCADVLLGPPGQQEGLPTDQSGWIGICRVIQAERQPVELCKVNVRKPEQRTIAGCKVLGDAPVMG